MRTPLSWAAAFGNIVTSRLLLHYNADPNSQDIEGKTPLIYACINGHAELCAQLLDWNGTHQGSLTEVRSSGFPLSTLARPNRFWPGHGKVRSRKWHHAHVQRRITVVSSHHSLWGQGRWDPDLEFLWDANTGRMPQAHALLRGHTGTAALLSSYWDRLILDARLVPPTATTKADEDDEATRGRIRFHSVIGMRKSTEYSPERLAGKEKNFWPWWWLETSLHVLREKIVKFDGLYMSWVLLKNL